LLDFHQTFVSSEPWDKDGQNRFWVQKVKGQGCGMTKYAKNTILSVCIHNICSIRLRFFQNSVASASWDKDELVGFLGQKVKGQGYCAAGEVLTISFYM